LNSPLRSRSDLKRSTVAWFWLAPKIRWIEKQDPTRSRPDSHVTVISCDQLNPSPSSNPQMVFPLPSETTHPILSSVAFTSFLGGSLPVKGIVISRAVENESLLRRRIA
jgi:hypothetical protein